MDLNDIILNTPNKVGIVFGPEKSGLDNNHISICDFVLKIESNPFFFLFKFVTCSIDCCI